MKGNQVASQRRKPTGKYHDQNSRNNISTFSFLFSPSLSFFSFFALSFVFMLSFQIFSPAPRSIGLLMRHPMMFCLTAFWNLNNGKFWRRALKAESSFENEGSKLPNKLIIQGRIVLEWFSTLTALLTRVVFKSISFMSYFDTIYNF